VYVYSCTRTYVYFRKERSYESTSKTLPSTKVPSNEDTVGRQGPEPNMEDLEDYGFEYSDEDSIEDDADIENQYYNAKGTHEQFCLMSSFLLSSRGHDQCSCSSLICLQPCRIVGERHSTRCLEWIYHCFGHGVASR
jgi:hypothetical protein